MFGLSQKNGTDFINFKLRIAMKQNEELRQIQKRDLINLDPAACNNF